MKKHNQKTLELIEKLIKRYKDELVFLKEHPPQKNLKEYREGLEAGYKCILQDLLYEKNLIYLENNNIPINSIDRNTLWYHDLEEK